MTIEEMLTELRGYDRQKSLMVYKGEYGDTWLCTLEMKDGSDEVKISRHASSPLAAVTDVYNAYRASMTKPFSVFTGKMIEAAPAIKPVIDDEVPF